MKLLLKDNRLYHSDLETGLLRNSTEYSGKFPRGTTLKAAVMHSSDFLETFCKTMAINYKI